MRFFLLFLLGLILAGCASKVLKYDHAEHLKKIDEFDQQVKIVVPAAPSPTGEVATAEKPAPKEEPAKPVKKKKTKKSKTLEPTVSLPAKHEPDIEGELGFVGRRPVIDPYRVNEKIEYVVTYLGMTAGSLDIITKPFAEVNGRKSYQFEMRGQTRSIFSSIYSLDDTVENLIDFEDLIPSVFTLHVHESHQLREARYWFDRSKGQANYWEKKVTEKDGEQQKKLQWEAPDFSQNVFSAIIYMRAFPWEVGTEHAFRVADDGQNLIFHAKAIRQEKIKIEAGEFDSIVINPQVELRGVAKTMGEIYIWISNDERKFILKIEGKIKIGTLSIEASKIDPGLP